MEKQLSLTDPIDIIYDIILDERTFRFLLRNWIKNIKDFLLFYDKHAQDMLSFKWCWIKTGKNISFIYKKITDKNLSLLETLSDDNFSQPAVQINCELTLNDVSFLYDGNKINIFYPSLYFNFDDRVKNALFKNAIYTIKDLIVLSLVKRLPQYRWLWLKALNYIKSIVNKIRWNSENFQEIELICNGDFDINMSDIELQDFLNNFINGCTTQEKDLLVNRIWYFWTSKLVSQREIGEKYNITSERVRQIEDSVKVAINNFFYCIYKSKVWEVLISKYFSDKYGFYSNEDFLPNSVHDFNFPFLYDVLKWLLWERYFIHRNNDLSKVFYVNNLEYDTGILSIIVNEFDKIYFKVRNKHEKLDLNSFLSNVLEKKLKRDTSIDEEKISIYYLLLKEYVIYFYWNIIDDFVVKLDSNKRHFWNLVTDELKLLWEPIHFSKFAEFLSKKYPEFKIRKETIHSLLMSDPNAVNVWRWIYVYKNKDTIFWTIPEVWEKYILEASNKRVKYEDLFKFIKNNLYCKEESIYGCLFEIDKKNRFVKLSGKEVGLKQFSYDDLVDRWEPNTEQKHFSIVVSKAIIKFLNDNIWEKFSIWNIYNNLKDEYWVRISSRLWNYRDKLELLEKQWTINKLEIEGQMYYFIPINSQKMSENQKLNLESNDMTLENILFGSKKCRIPRFQRPYSWEEEHISDLWNDLDSNDRPYFFGTFIFNYEHFDSESSVIDVIDWQQRLLTITILMAVLRDLMKVYNPWKSGVIQRKTISFEDKHWNACGDRVECWETNRNFFKMYIQNEDADILHATPSSKEERRIKENYLSLRGKIQENLDKFSDNKDRTDYLDKIYEKVFNLLCIHIKITTEEDAYEIFETVNARGVDLSIADLLKNLIFNKLTKGKGKINVEEIKDKRLEIENNIKPTGIEMKKFIRYHRMSKYWFITEKKLYKEIKNDVNDYWVFLDELLESSNLFYAMLEWYKEDISNVFPKDADKIYNYLNALRILNVTQCYVFFLSIMRNMDKISVNVSKLFNIVENFTFNYSTITKWQANKLEKVYSSYAIDIENVCQESNEKVFTKKFSSTVENFKNELRNLKHSKEEFVIKFSELSYWKSEKNRILIKYVLSKINQSLENYPEHMINFEQVNIEHLLAQKPNKQSWLKRTDIKDFVDGIWNLTLIHKKINSIVWNKTVKDKIPDLKASKIRLTELLVEQLEQTDWKWGKEEIDQRWKALAELAYDKIWII